MPNLSISSASEDSNTLVMMSMFQKILTHQIEENDCRWVEDSRRWEADIARKDREREDDEQ